MARFSVKFPLHFIPFQAKNEPFYHVIIRPTDAMSPPSVADKKKKSPPCPQSRVLLYVLQVL